jgi:hypothetical protein
MAMLDLATTSHARSVFKKHEMIVAYRSDVAIGSEGAGEGRRYLPDEDSSPLSGAWQLLAKGQ